MTSLITMITIITMITMITMLKMMKIGDEVLMIEFSMPSPWRPKPSFTRSVL